MCNLLQYTMIIVLDWLLKFILKRIVVGVHSELNLKHTTVHVAKILTTLTKVIIVVILLSDACLINK